MLFLNFVIVLLNFSPCFSAIPGYYWRDYHGTIPSDAIVAGIRDEDVPLYIGQAYIRDGGLINGQIIGGESDMFVQFEGVAYVQQYIKILCGVQNNFSWLTTSSATLDSDLRGKTAVIGGHEDEEPQSYVARLNGTAGTTYIGRVLNSGVYQGIFLGVNDLLRTIQETENFEILIYDP